MAKALRVHQLAKELGVKSKVIVDKCVAEGVPDIVNHMSTVKLGLAVTVRQWFDDAADEGAVATAVETADKVDLKTVRKKAARKKATPKADPAPPLEDADAQSVKATQTAEASSPAPAEQAAQTQTVEADPDTQAQATPATSPQAPQADDPPVAKKKQAPAQPQDTADAKPAPPATQPADADAVSQVKAKVAAIGMPNVPTRPDIIKPVGEQLATPQKAVMRGPKVIRVEKPEPVDTQRSRPRGPRPGGPGNGNGGNTMGGEVEGITRSRGPARGRGAGSGNGGGPDTTRKRRQLNTRRGRSADALPTGPSKFTQADMEELDARLKGSAGFVKKRRRDLRTREGGGHAAQSALVTGGKVEIQEPITIKGLSSSTGIKAADIIKYLFTQKKVMATVNSAIDTEAAMEIALEYEIELEVQEQETAEQVVVKQFEDREPIDTRPRPPVVTILGHVDHGKTSLLDKIRDADIAAHEAGGITQHVGAYRVTIKGSDDTDKTVVFLDTPGHEAFTSMRSRGASMTDLIVLVCAADDGVMPQTIESINHAKAAGVPVIVALNKIDVPRATPDNVQKIYGQLAEHGLNPSEWGGDTEIVKTSAQTGQGITELIEILDLQAEMLELTADYGGNARGTVIEAEMQPGRGPVARVLVQEGQIKVGDFIVSGRAFGRCRDMTDDRARPIKDAGPATPLEMSGLDEIPDAGDHFYVTDSLRKAEGIAQQYRDAERKKMLASQTKVTLDNFAATVAAGNIKELRVVLKADVQGTLDVLKKSLEKLGNDEVGVKVIHSAVGGITESDVLLADASEAIVVGFHVIATAPVREIAEARKVDVRLYRVIYDVTDEVKQALEGMLAPERQENDLGSADVKQVFKIGGLGMVAGCVVSEGVLEKSAKVKLVRDGVIVTADRNLQSLRRVKDEVREVHAGTECGVRIAGFEDVKPGDTMICYTVTEVARTLD